MTQTPSFILPAEELDRIIAALALDGHRVLGPVLDGERLTLGKMEDASRLPRGLVDRRGPGSFRLEQGPDGAFFGVGLGQESWKQFLFPPVEKIIRARVSDGGFETEPAPLDETPMAFLGVRPCELAALAIHDRVLMMGPYPDARYALRRAGLFTVAVECTRPGAVCFCADLGTGPGAERGFDIALTEVVGPDGHHFVARAGSRAGESLLARLGLAPADDGQVRQARDLVAEAAQAMPQKLDTDGLKQALQDNHEHPHWQEVAARCLACANCTLVCPTCFCHDLADSQDLDGRKAGRTRRWASCFLPDFSYIHGGAVRRSAPALYRQWCTHKLAHWVDQFGVTGCVGCGRCITWCPAGIDIAAEAMRIKTDISKGERP